jgi:hypothetical protein
VLPLETAKQYCTGGFASTRAKGDHLVLTFRSDDEEGEEWIDEDNDTLASLLPVRAELANGDLRALYIAWLGCVEAGEVEDEAREPACPPGLGNLSPALEAFADFLRINDDLIDAAATASREVGATDDAALGTWVATLSETERTSLLARLVGGTDAHLRAELLRRFRAWRLGQTPAAKTEARTVGELLEAAKMRADERHRREAERAAREKKRRNREAADARAHQLAALARREADAWREVDETAREWLAAKFSGMARCTSSARPLSEPTASPRSTRAAWCRTTS